jgi:putative Mg2+ transporter-C (MgtC) family protein
MDLNILDIFLKLGVALILGGIVGLERSLAGKTAGMRTYAMVALGSALFVVIGESISNLYIGTVALDPLRIASQIVVGVGFIGAGLVIFQGNKIQGITTAAGLWVSAGVGMACGFGLYQIGIVGTILALGVFTVMWFLESKLKLFSYGVSEDCDDKNKPQI